MQFMVTLGKKAPFSAILTFRKLSVTITAKFTADEIATAERYVATTPPADIDPRIEALVTELIGRVADKWTMMVVEALTESGTLRFSRLAEAIGGISQKMLTQTLRAMERDGLVNRTVYPVVPPKVEYRLTQLGLTLGAAFCGVWIWASDNLVEVEKARAAFDQHALNG